jgi:hypothetical protein
MTEDDHATHHFQPTGPQSIVDITMTALYYRDIAKHWESLGDYKRSALFLFQAFILRMDSVMDSKLSYVNILNY